DQKKKKTLLTRNSPRPYPWLSVDLLSPTISRRRRHHPRRSVPAISGRMQHAPKLRPALPFVQIHASRSAPLPAARDSGAPVFLPPSAQVGPLANEQHPAPARAQADEQYGDWPRTGTSAGAAAGEAVAAADLVTAGSARRSWPAGIAVRRCRPWIPVAG
uniref:Uncharacterized protein n=1 Tax=Aegilops tauschii subsp. strangulata TaxID=200361 RepID=A0A453JU72_AEGTS